MTSYVSKSVTQGNLAADDWTTSSRYFKVSNIILVFRSKSQMAFAFEIFLSFFSSFTVSTVCEQKSTLFRIQKKFTIQKPIRSNL